MSSLATAHSAAPATDPDQQAPSELALRDRVLESTRLAARGLAHDLNSPLQILADATYLLREGLASVERDPSAAAIGEMHDAITQATDAFVRLKAMSGALAHLLPPPETVTHSIRLDHELTIVAALTRHEWHRDIDLTINGDPRVNVVGVPRLLFRQLVTDVLLSVVAFTMTTPAPAGRGAKRGVELRGGLSGDQIVIEAETVRDTSGPTDPIDVAELGHGSLRLGYASLLSGYGITVSGAPGVARATLGASFTSQDGLFIV